MLSRGYACCDPDQKDCSACIYPKLRVLGPGCLDFLGLLNQQQAFKFYSSDMPSETSTALLAKTSGRLSW